MVAKSRVKYTYEPVSYEGQYYTDTQTHLLAESMQDSSVSGSPRTEVDAVDAFIEGGTARRVDFHRALQQSYKTAGDAGLAHFKVQRTKQDFNTFTGVISGQDRPHAIVNWVGQAPSYTTYPSITPYAALSDLAMADEGERLYLRALPNEDQNSLGESLIEIGTNPARAVFVPGRNLGRAIAGHGAGRESRIVERLGLLQRSRDDAVAAAQDYLAYIFGARPNMEVLDNLADAYSRSRRHAETITRYRAYKASGGVRRVRRRRYRNYPVRVASSTQETFMSGSALPMKNWRLYGTRHLWHTSEKRVWWSGSFRMVCSDTEQWLARCQNLFREMDRLTGMGLDVPLSWDLVPFSFVADWFANTGDLLSARQQIADYNIACEYGYVMCHTRESWELTMPGQLLQWGSPYYGTARFNAHYTRLFETKQRSRCDAYGFHTNFDNLNPFQWGALTALGLSRLPGVRPIIRA